MLGFYVGSVAIWWNIRLLIPAKSPRGEFIDHFIGIVIARHIPAVFIHDQTGGTVCRNNAEAIVQKAVEVHSHPSELNSQCRLREYVEQQT